MKSLRFAFQLFPIVLCGSLTFFAARMAAQTTAPAAAPVTPGATATLTVSVTAIRNATGKIRMTLYRDSNPVGSREVEIDPKTLIATVVFDKIPQGTYAVYLMHDENQNGKLDMDDMGMPLEGYGMSNNPPRREGRPGFDETNFQIAKPSVAIEISMIYWQ